jgi:hypothetical protein
MNTKRQGGVRIVTEVRGGECLGSVHGVSGGVLNIALNIIANILKESTLLKYDNRSVAGLEVLDVELTVVFKPHGTEDQIVNSDARVGVVEVIL